MTACKRTMLKWILSTLFIFIGLSPTAQAGERVIIGVSPALSATLSIIAKQHGFFSQQGIDADIRVIESGSKAVTLMLNDELDISESAVFAIVSNSFSRKDFRVMTQVSTTGNSNKIIARKDHGIRKIDDLVGKKVGVLKAGFPLYVLDLMLLNAGLDSKNVKLVFEETERLYQMLSSGELDAACLYGIWCDKATKALKDNAVVFHDEKIAHVTVVHAGKTETLERNPDLYSRVLKAYIKAEEHVKKNPETTLETVVDYLKLDMGNAREAWRPNLVHVALEQSLIKDMENQAQWQIDTGMINSLKIPNYLDFIHFRSLMEIDPKRVTITQ
ncbi:MAG: ABC transporter substrate-binding protein [Pseudomonadota bacterium]